MSVYITKDKGGTVTLFDVKPFEDFKITDPRSIDGKPMYLGYYKANIKDEPTMIQLNKTGVEKLNIEKLSFETSPIELKYKSYDELFKAIKLIPFVDFKVDKEMHFVFEINYYGDDMKTLIVEKPSYIEDKYMMFHFLMGLKSECETILHENIVGIGYQRGETKLSGWAESYLLFKDIDKDLLKSE